jgi:sec-independent protein translocase protein TatB
MQIFNIGPLELILVLIVMFILLGPSGMVNTARSVGKFIRSVIKSPMWGEIMGYSKEIRDLPTKLVRETGLDEDIKEIKKTAMSTTDELNRTVQEANHEIKTEINDSLKETGSVNVAIDMKPTTPGNEKK